VARDERGAWCAREDCKFFVMTDKASIDVGHVFPNVTIQTEQVGALCKSHNPPKSCRIVSRSGRNYHFKCTGLSCPWELRTSIHHNGKPTITKFVKEHNEMCQNVYKHAVSDLREMKSLNEFIKGHPNCTYSDVVNHLSSVGLELKLLLSQSGVYRLMNEIKLSIISARARNEEVVDDARIVNDAVAVTVLVKSGANSKSGIVTVGGGTKYENPLKGVSHVFGEECCPGWSWVPRWKKWKECHEYVKGYK